MEHDILIEEDGTIRFVYSDTIGSIFKDEAQQTVRASHVEPHPNTPGWIADMRPSGGPILGDGAELDVTPPADPADIPAFLERMVLKPFATRQAALDAEREWLRKEKGL